MQDRIPRWESSGPETIKMEGHPFFIERRMYGNRPSFRVSWRQGEKIIRADKSVLMLSLATDTALKWASERNLFGDPEIDG